MTAVEGASSRDVDAGEGKKNKTVEEVAKEGKSKAKRRQGSDAFFSMGVTSEKNRFWSKRGQCAEQDIGRGS